MQLSRHALPYKSSDRARKYGGERGEECLLCKYMTLIPSRFPGELSWLSSHLFQTTMTFGGGSYSVMDQFGLVICGTLILLIVCLFKYVLTSQRPKDFPPGPPCLPIIGNLHQIPLRKAFLRCVFIQARPDAPSKGWLTKFRYQEWSKEYGTIIGLKLGPKNAVVLNSYRHVQE
jgi:hypothetical protein